MTDDYIRDRLTVIITIRNRRNTLLRAINYYKDFPANVIFLDSTAATIYDKCYMAAPNLYMHVPKKNYVQKIHDCLKTIDTKYTVVICDDDFLSSTGLEKSIKFLEENENYVGCRGQEVALFDNFLSYETLDYLIDKLDDFHSEQQIERVYRSWTYFNGSAVHNILKTEVQVKIQEFHLEFPQFNAINFYDKTLSYIAAAAGDIARLPVFHFVRSSETKARSLKLWPTAQNDISDWNPDLRFRQHFLNCDTAPLEDLIGVDRLFIEQIYNNLCDSVKKDRKFSQILEENNLLTLDCYNPTKIWGYPLYTRLGTGANIFGEQGFKEKFKMNTEDPTRLYPVLEKENLDELYKIIKFVKDYPL